VKNTNGIGSYQRKLLVRSTLHGMRQAVLDASLLVAEVPSKDVDSAMNSQPIKLEVAGSPHAPPSTALHGRWLLVARVAWVVAALLAVMVFVAGLPAYYEQLRTFSGPIGAFFSPEIEDPAAVRANLARLGLSAGFYAAYIVALEVLLTFAFCVVGTVIFWRRSDDWMALLAAIFLMLQVGEAPTLALAATYHSWWFPVDLLGVLAVASFILFFYLFPDGRFVPRWTRWIAVVGVLLTASFTFFPGWNARYPYATIVILYLSGLLITCVFAQLYRYVRVSGPVERQQTKWVVFGLTTAVVGVLGLDLLSALFPALDRTGTLPDLVGQTAENLFILLVPVSIGFAVLRYRLWDIDVLINHTLVYGTLTTSVVGLYILMVGSLGTLLQERGNILVSLLATGLVAVLFQPLREHLQRGINRLMYGERDEPYKVLSRLGRRLEATLAPSMVLQTIVETVAQALKLPYVAIALKQDGEFVTAAEYGTSVDEPIVLPLVYHKETVGRLVLSPRAPKEPFGPADRRLLDDIARHAEVAVHAVRLTADLQHSRERLVTTREEERRRLRRDLHDGLGPQLATLTLKLDAARNLLPHEPKATDALLAELKAETQAAIADIRRLVYALRPPALDELGLVSAIREQATNYGLPQGPEGEADHADTVVFSLEAPEQLPPLSAAVEVAAYRIAQEAITNVARHARARTCRIRISLGKELQLEIIDDGVGLPLDRHAGVGLTSMRERAAELGGSCVIEPIPTGGTRVLVRLPLPPSEE
jgi:signal transduction histidine kinase